MLLALSGILLIGAEFVVDIPEGMSVTNTTHVNASASGDTFVKTGRGTYVLASNVRLGYTVFFGNIEVREGMLASIDSSEIHQTAGSKVKISSGATMIANSPYTFGQSNSKPDVVIDEGGVFDIKGRDWLGSSSVPTISGAGTIKGPGVTLKGTSATRSLGAQLAAFTGTILADTPNYYFYAGDETAAHDVPFGQMKGVVLRTSGYSMFRFYLENALPATLRSLTGSGGYIEPKANLTIDYANVGEFSLHPYAAVTVRKGRIGFYSSRSNPNDIDMLADGVVLTFADGDYASMPGTGVFSSQNKTTKLASPSGVPMRISKEATLTLANGATFRAANSLPKFLNVLDGSTLELTTANFYVGGTTSADSPGVVRLDGGTIRVLSDATGSSSTFGRNYNALKVAVGAKGGEIRGDGDYGNPTVTFDTGVKIESAAGTAGPFTLGGRMSMTVKEPLALAGDVRLLSGTASFANTANMRASSSVTGTGNLTLGNVLVSGKMSAGSPLNLGTAPGTKITINGPGTVDVGTDTGNRLTLGASDATSSPLVFAKGGALWLQAENVTTELLGSTAKVMVNGGMAMSGPFVAQPVFLFSKWNGNWGGTPWPLKYDATNGFSEFKDYVNSLTAGPDSVACVCNKTLSSSAAVAGLLVTTMNLSTKFTGGPSGDGYTSTGDPLSSTGTLKINGGATLTVGGSGGYAPVFLLSAGDTSLDKQGADRYRGVATIKGAGTLNFGSSEGYVTCGTRGAGISCPIAGTAGVTFTAPASLSGYSDTFLGRVNVFLAGHSTYSGGTRLYGLSVRPYVDDAFGTGDVWIQGDGAGSSTAYVRIDEGLDLTFANGFHLAGCGMSSAGAVYAQGKVRFAGPVDLGGVTRVAVRLPAGEIRFAGPLSGDSLQVWNSATNKWDASGRLVKAYDAVGKVVIDTADNTLTGRITLVRSSLKLAAGAKLSVGTVWLDDGLLEVEAADDLSLGASVYGFGEVRLSGRPNRLVSFPARETNPLVLQQSCVLDVNNRNRAVSSLAGFTSVTNRGTRAVHLSVLNDAAGSFAGAVDPRVTLHYGKLYTHGLTVFVH